MSGMPSCDQMGAVRPAVALFLVVSNGTQELFHTIYGAGDWRTAQKYVRHPRACLSCKSEVVLRR